jgi:hypothetical protein
MPAENDLSGGPVEFANATGMIEHLDSHAAWPASSDLRGEGSVLH